MNDLSPESAIYKLCLRELSNACGIYGLLPDSCKVKSVPTIDPHPIARGGFSDIWRAVNENGEKITVKALRLYETSTAPVKKVDDPFDSLLSLRISDWVSVWNFRNTARL